MYRKMSKKSTFFAQYRVVRISWLLCIVDGNMGSKPVLQHQRFVLSIFFAKYTYTEPANTCSKLILETVEHGLKFVQN